MSSERAILIVDNNKGFATMLKQSLEQEGGYRAAVTTDGESALQAMTSIPFDLAIVDLGLSDPDGAVVARSLRQQKADLRLMLIPIAGDEIPPDLADLDIQGILPKPFFLPELPSRIADALEKPVKIAAPPPPIEEPAAAQAEEAAPGPAITQPIPTAPAPRKEPPASALSRAGRPAPPAPSAPAPAAGRTGGIREHLPEIIEKMTMLAQDVNADAVLLTSKGRVISHTGRIAAEGAVGLAQAIDESWRTAARVAQILGKDLQRFEQITEGGEHLLYSLAVVEDIILTTVLLANVPLGMIRHRTKDTADALRTLMGVG